MEQDADKAMTEEFLTTNSPETGTPEAGEAGNDAPSEPGSVDELPEWAQQALAKARKEAAKYRSRARKAPEADDMRAELRREMMTEVAAARIEAALTGVVEDPAGIVEDLNLSRYVTDDGELDSDAIAALKSKYARIVKRPGVGQGRTGTKPPASTADQFAEVLRGLGA